MTNTQKDYHISWTNRIGNVITYDCSKPLSIFITSIASPTQQQVAELCLERLEEMCLNDLQTLTKYGNVIRGQLIIDDYLCWSLRFKEYVDKGFYNARIESIVKGGQACI